MTLSAEDADVQGVYPVAAAALEDRHADIDARVVMCEREIDVEGDEVKRIKDALQGGADYLCLSCPQDKDALLRCLEASQKKESQLRAEKWQLREPRQARQRLPRPTAPGVFVLEASIRDSKRIKGLRSILYLQAEEHFAFHNSSDVEESIKYEEDSLVLKLLFMTAESAMTFQSVLTDLNTGQPVSELRGSVKIEEIYRKACPVVVTRVMRDQYEPNASGLPYATLADMAADSIPTTSESEVAAQTPLFLYQSLESSAVAEAIGLHKAYIKAKAECDESEQEDENNVLALSPNMHKIFVGDEYRGRKSMVEVQPSIAIRGGTVSSEEVMAGTAQKRQKVELLIECIGPDAFEAVKHLLKDGTTDDGDRLFRCSVYVENPEVFKAHLDWRYKRVKAIWGQMSWIVARHCHTILT